MRTREAQGSGWLYWSVALEGVFGGIIVSLFFVARGDLHPALALPLVGLGIVGALARAVLVRDRGETRPPKTAEPSSDAVG